MQLHDSEAILRYYWEELTYLRRMGEIFARRHPKVAGRLELQPDQSPDPHVERLIESFAFLTARIQRDIDNDFPEVATELLNLLHPHYLRPVPPLTVARFDVDPEQGKLTSGYTVPRHTPLFTHSTAEQICKLRTCYPVTLWPLELTFAGLESPDRFDFLDRMTDVATVMRLRIERRADPLAELELDRLRFYLNGERLLVSALYEGLFTHTLGVAIVPDRGEPRILPKECLLPVGFGLDEEVLPYPSYSQPAYRLLQEYFVFPEKFYFFDLAGLECIRELGAEDHVDVLIISERSPLAKIAATRETFVLGATPVVNLFSQTTEPIRIDHLRTEYRLVPDVRRERTTEVHTIRSVSGSSDHTDETRHYKPFYSFSHEMAGIDHRTFWHSRRVPTVLPGVKGTEVRLSFVDLDFNPRLPPTETIYARTLCTNRELAEQIPAGGVLQTDEALPVKKDGGIVCLMKPTQMISPPLGGQNLWRLISHLSLNYLSLTGGDESLAALREILKLYAYSSDAATHQQIMGVREMTTRPVVRRIGSEAWRGFCRGTEVTVTFDEDLYAGTNAFLLGAVLNRFFGLYCSTNTFSQLVMRSWQRKEEWKRWAPMVGEKRLQ